MPRNNREQMKRYADEALNDLTRALDNLGILYTAYSEGQLVKNTPDGEQPLPAQVQPTGTHEKYALMVEGIGTIVTQAMDLLQSFRQNNM